MSEVEAWLTDHLPKPGTRLALDIGANVGGWTVVLSRLCAEVHAFEPNPQALPILRGFTTTRQNVRLFDAAVGDSVGDIDLHLYESSAWASAYREGELDAWRAGEPAETITVPRVSLDALGYEERPVEFMKIDVEGAERDVLIGAAGTVIRQRPALLVEIHTAANREWTLDFLGMHGYQPELIPHPHDGVPDGHCWVVAASD